MKTPAFLIVGAGPAGLAAAYALAKNGRQAAVLEQSDHVGGLARTIERRGFRFDIGGHRFFTKNAEVDALWREILGEEFLHRPRLSRIYYRRKFFDYPITPMNALVGLGPWSSLQVVASYVKRRLLPRKPECNFEDWVSNRFGDRLYRIFFKTYTEKVWGIPCEAISADWAAQRIRNLDLGRALLDAMGLLRREKVASLIDAFDYPRYGPGQMYEEMARQAAALGVDVRLENRVAKVFREDGRITAVSVESPAGSFTLPVENLISSMPLSDLILACEPAPPAEVAAAARELRYRSLVTVNLLVRQREVAPDTWIYLHAPEIRASRLQLYKNWSPAMVPDPAWSSLGLEYFAFEGDSLWSLSDDELLRIGKCDIQRLGLVDADRIQDGFVVRYPKAYPVYDEGYRDRVATIRRFLDAMKNMVPVGRYGQFRYNNMDQAILTALLAVRRLLGENVDPWQVNADAIYHESGEA